jgi:hypothetical protein
LNSNSENFDGEKRKIGGSELEEENKEENFVLCVLSGGFV